MPFPPNSALREKNILGGNRACETPISTICLRYFFSQALILEKIAIPGQPPVPEHWNEGMSGYAKFIDLRD